MELLRLYEDYMVLIIGINFHSILDFKMTSYCLHLNFIFNYYPTRSFILTLYLVWVTFIKV